MTRRPGRQRRPVLRKVTTRRRARAPLPADREAAHFFPWPAMDPEDNAWMSSKIRNSRCGVALSRRRSSAMIEGGRTHKAFDVILTSFATCRRPNLPLSRGCSRCHAASVRAWSGAGSLALAHFHCGPTLGSSRRMQSNFNTANCCVSSGKAPSQSVPPECASSRIELGVATREGKGGHQTAEMNFLMSHFLHYPENPPGADRKVDSLPLCVQYSLDTRDPAGPT